MPEPIVSRPGEGEMHSRSEGYRLVRVDLPDVGVIEIDFDESPPSTRTPMATTPTRSSEAAPARAGPRRAPDGGFIEGMRRTIAGGD